MFRRYKLLRTLTAILIACFLAQLLVIAPQVNAAGSAAAANEGDGLTLVRHHQADSVIIWWSKDSGSKVAPYAAAELQKYARKMTGATVPVLQGTISAESAKEIAQVSSAIVVVTGDEAKQYADSGQVVQVPGQWLASADTRLSGAAEDAFVAVENGSRLVLAGTNDRGTLYSVYDLLERVGVAYFAPDFDYYYGHAEYVPDSDSLVAPGLDAVIEPSFKIRRKYVEEGFSHTSDNLPQLVDWMAKNKLNTLVVPYDYIAQGKTRWDDWRQKLLPELEKRGVIVEVGGHGFESFLRKEKYGAEHPDWFVAGHNVFNIASDDAVAAYVSEVIAYLKARPEIGVFDAWPPDVATWPPVVINKFGSTANAYAYVVNKLHAALREQLPGVRLEAIAYASHDQPPSSEYMYDESVMIDFAPYFRSYRDTVFNPDSSVNKPSTNLINKWRNVFQGDLTMYEYYRRYAFHSLPVVFPKLIGEELPYYRTLGLNGIGTYSEPADWITYEITHLILAKMSWNADLNANDLISDYVQARYGTAFSEMSEYFRLTEEAGRTVFNSPTGDYNNKTAVTKMRDNYLQAKSQISKAQLIVAAGSPAAYMLERLMWNIDYAIADTEVEYYRLNNEAGKVQEAKLLAQSLLNAHRFDGIMLQNSYSLRKYINNHGGNSWIYDMYRGKLNDAPMVTTMGTYQNNPISNIVDGDEGTLYWSNLNPAVGDYVGIDLGSVKSIRNIEIKMASAAKPNDYIRNGVVEVSADFKQWKTIAEVTNQPEVQVAAGDDTEARFIRIRTTAPQTQWIQIREFRVEAAEPQEETRTTLAADRDTMRVGEKAAFTLGVAGVADQVYGLDLTLEYDSNALELISVDSAKDGLALIESKKMPGKVRLIMASQGAAYPVTGATPVAKLVFRALGASEMVQVTTSSSVLGGSSGVETVAASATAVIRINGLPSGNPGDINGDGKVSIGDLAIVAANYGKTTASPDWKEVEHLDIKADGVLDILDLSAIANKIIN